MPNSDPLGRERRQYIRLDTVLPVQFRILSLDAKEYLSDWLQGFTNNIGKGGICLSVNILKKELARILKDQQAKISLSIEIPFSVNPIEAKTKVMWVKDIPGQADRYLIGLNYDEINPAASNRLLHYAQAKKIFVPAVLAIIFILGLGFAFGSYLNVKLINGNKAIVEQLVKIVQESSVAKQKIKEINKEREDLGLKIQALQLEIKTVEEAKEQLSEKTKLEESTTAKSLEQMSVMVEKLTKEKNALQESLSFLQDKENAVTEELLSLDKRKASLEKANLDKMYQWLRIHQGGRTGLVASYEGDGDIANWAFIYDQALVVQLYTNFSDFERARKILDFFKSSAQRQGKSFFNAYYATDGHPAEYVVHSGPNIWLGMSMLQYTYKSKDDQYLALAEELAGGIISLQNEDGDGGIRGGPNFEWYSTEHNLDAYAFFDMLYKITGKPEYLKARDRALNWVVRHTYDANDGSLKRGKGDSSIATDTFAFAIAAVGPEKLEEAGMNPDLIIDFAEKKCAIEAVYERPEGQTVKVRGFDFAPQEHVARGGIVSPEWTAQMVVAFKKMSDFYYKKGLTAKARTYALKADEYLVQLSKMIISSPSPSGQGQSCLPYATQDLVDTGHGWKTPKGKSTGSVAGTAYTLLAYYNYNPLELR